MTEFRTFHPVQDPVDSSNLVARAPIERGVSGSAFREVRLAVQRTLLVATIAALFCVVAGCASNSESTHRLPKTPTIEGNGAIPARDIEGFFSPIKWSKIRSLHYQLCVIASGTINNGHFHVMQITQKFGDESLLPEARRLFGTIRLDPSRVGSHIVASAMAYVILYPREFDGSLALVYAKQVDYDATRDAVAAEYLKTEKY